MSVTKKQNKPLAPKTILRIKKLWPRAGKYYKIGQTLRVNYYSKLDGLDCVWLIDDSGGTAISANHHWIREHFEVVEPSSETSMYGYNRPLLGPLHPPLFRVWQLGHDKSEDVTLEKLQAMLQHPRNRLRIASLCDHKESYYDGGVRYCCRCQDALEVTSFRD